MQRNGHRVVNDCEILDTQWITLNTGQCFGAVLVDNGYERKVYCGLGSGHNAEVDEEYIVLHGSKMYPFSWIPFLSKAWSERVDKYCSKCGVELNPEQPEQCPACGDRKEDKICD